MATLADVVASGFRVLNTQYSWGGGGPNGPSYGFAQGANTRGFDCSSLMQYMYSQGAGIRIPRTSQQQWNASIMVPLSNLRVGDLVFSNFGSDGPGHVGMYVGRGMVIQAPKTGDVVKIVTLSAFGAKAGGRIPSSQGLDLGDIESVYSGGRMRGSASGGGSGVGGGYTSSQMLPGSGWSKGDFESALAASGYTSAFINSDKELKTLFQKAVTNMWSTDRFLGELKKTKWWTSRSDAQRKYDQLRLSDSAEFDSQYNEKYAELQALANDFGITIDASRLHSITASVLRSGLNTAQTRQLIVAEFHYDPSKTYAGQVGKALGDYKGLASAYMQQLNDGDYGWWLAETLNGRQDASSYTQMLKDHAKAKWAHFADKIDAGMTMQQIADPYRQEYSKILEVDPNSIADDDQILLKGLDFRDPTSGNRGAMTLWQYGDELRGDPRWLKTDNAKSSVMGTANKVLQAMGLVAM